jgi:O-antigen/teichoic acid export membrane protein
LTSDIATTQVTPEAAPKSGARRSPSLDLEGGISLKASLGYSFVSQAFYLLSQLGVLSALAHFRGPQAVGEFGLALALTTPVFLLLNMGFRTTQAVDVGSDFSFSHYGGTRIILTALAAVVSVGLAAAYSDSPTTFTIVLVVALAKVFESISNLAYGAFQQGGRMDLVALSYGLRGGITLAVFVTMLWLGADTTLALTSQLIVWAAISLFLDYPRASKISAGKFVWPHFSPVECWNLLKHSAPLGGGLLANSLQMTAVRLMVERFLGLEQLGLFTAVAYFQQAGVTASNSVSNAIVNRLARMSRNGQTKGLRRILLRLLFLFLAVSAVGIGFCYFFGRELLTLLYGQAYATASQLLLMISIVVSLRMIATLPQSLLFAERRYKEFFGFQIASLLLTVILGYFLIPRFGIEGGGYVLLSVALFRFLVVELVVMLRPRGQAAVVPEPPHARDHDES